MSLQQLLLPLLVLSPPHQPQLLRLAQQRPPLPACRPWLRQRPHPPAHTHLLLLLAPALALLCTHKRQLLRLYLQAHWLPLPQTGRGRAAASLRQVA
jgi:hypothetical protein